MRPKKYIKPERVNFIVEATEKRAAIKALREADFTLSEFLQECMRRVATGEMVVKRATRPLQTSSAKVAP